MGDVDGDRSPEIVLVDGWYDIVIVSARGQIERRFPIVGGEILGTTAPALGDLDGDGLPEIVVLTDGFAHCFHGDGQACQGWPVLWPTGGGGDAFWIGNNGPVIGDVDGDLSPDVVFSLQTAGVSTTGEVRVYDRWGNMHPHFPKLINIGPGAVPAIADIDLDGRNEIVVMGSYWDGSSGYFDKVWVYDLHGSNYGTIEWGQFGGGPRHQGYYPTPTLAVSGVDLYVRAPAMAGGGPGETATIWLEVGNLGSTPGISTVLTAELDSSLAYLDDTSGVVPAIVDNTVTWPLPSAGHPFRKRFSVRVQVPAQAAYGTRYPVTWAVSSSSPDADATDNVALTDVTVSHSSYVPLVARGSPQE